MEAHENCFHEKILTQSKLLLDFSKSEKRGNSSFSIVSCLQVLFLPHFFITKARFICWSVPPGHRIERLLYVQFTSCFQGVGPLLPSCSSDVFFYIQDTYFACQPQMNNSYFHDANLASIEICVFFTLPCGYGKKLFSLDTDVLEYFGCLLL